MVTRLKATDMPQPWFQSKKTNASKSKKTTTSSKFDVSAGSASKNSLEKPSMEGKRRKKVQKKGVQVWDSEKEASQLPSSSRDVEKDLSKTLVADVGELRRKMEEDAAACGRTVRTISRPHGRKRSPNKMKMHFRGGDGNDVVDPVGPSSVPQSSQKIPPITRTADRRSVLSADESIRIVEDDFECMEKSKEDDAPAFSQRPGKEKMSPDVHEEVEPPKTVSTTVVRELADTYSDKEAEEQSGGRIFRRQRRSPSPTKRYGDGDLQRRQLSSERGHVSRRGHCYEEKSRSPPKNWSQSSPLHDRWSPARSYPRSPVRRGEVHHQRMGQESEKYYEGRYAAPSYDEDYRGTNRQWSRDILPLGRHESSSAKESPQRKTSYSCDRSQHLQSRSCTPHSPRSPPRMSMDGSDSRALGWYASVPMKEASIVCVSPAASRKKRRHEQQCRESEKNRREREGKKPFYLTLDDEGRPYGPGRPAWIAEINKLSAGLDPSCTNIRKQSFGAVQTFKERLSEKFDYSGILNEDNLRGLLGKAITKRRGELISFIKNGGEQPKHIDEEVWLRLEKLATSRQREQKSEQGRYANSCRRTVGRTGSTGRNGVREKLRELLRRSPDPDEIEEEMQRDKGFGGQKRKIQAFSFKNEKSSSEVGVCDEDLRSPRVGKSWGQIPSETGQWEPYKRHAKTVSQDVEDSDDGVEEVDTVTRKTDRGPRSYSVRETKKMSKDEYIEKLEADIERLQANSAKASASNAVMPSQSSIFKEYRNRE